MNSTKFIIYGLFRVISISISAAAFAQPTAFTYQGSLKNSGAPANGLHDFRFRLYDAASGGAQLGGTQCIDNLFVDQGTFTATIDFGQQFVTPTQKFIEVEVRADTGLSCADLGNFVILSPRRPLSATPLANHAKSAFSLDTPNGTPDAVFVDNAGRVGIGTTSPGVDTPGIKLDVNGGAIRAMNSGDQADLFWLASERSWVFRQQGIGSAAALKLESIGGGGNKNFVIQTTGNVGIGTATPTAKLDVTGDLEANSIRSGAIQASGSITSGSLFVDGANFGVGVLQARNSSEASGSVGIFGATTSTSLFVQNMIGVHGSVANASSNSFGVFSTGRMGATGTKSFRIDHPEDPRNKYLFHYCAESPEVINFYRGTVRLDNHGRAVVTLPSYFARINTNPSYQLTPVGAPMPMLHIAARINEQSLQAGALAQPESATPICWFGIEGGVPGGEVSWRVEALRNDEFVRRNGAPVQIDKPPQERGTTSGEVGLGR